MLIRYQVELLTRQELEIPPRFSTYLTGSRVTTVLILLSA